jgi:hypothetical protein
VIVGSHRSINHAPPMYGISVVSKNGVTVVMWSNFGSDIVEYSAIAPELRTNRK